MPGRRRKRGDTHTVTEIGTTLGGRYRLVELLGQGGMATIYRARDAQLDRDVAVKLLRPEFGQDPDFLARFRDEAKAAASLSHPNIVAVFDFGEEESGPYIVMELVEGEDLGSILRGNGPLAPRQAARVSAETAKALQAAHIRGIVHRDVKPSNILVGRDGRIKVADFGIARALNEAQITLPGTTMGSVHYFSPEQARGEPATVASDIYALGIVLFETLTGQRPFSGDGAAAVALARLTTTPPRPSALRAGVPPELDAIVTKAMALDPGGPLRVRRRDGQRARGLPDRSVRPHRRDPGRRRGRRRGRGRDRRLGHREAQPARPVPAGRLRAIRAGARVHDQRHAAPAPRHRPRTRRAAPARGRGSPACSGIAVLVVIGFLLFRLLTGGGAADGVPVAERVRGAGRRPDLRRHAVRRRAGAGARARPRADRERHRGVRRGGRDDPEPGPGRGCRRRARDADPGRRRARPGVRRGARPPREDRGRGDPADRGRRASCRGRAPRRSTRSSRSARSSASSRVPGILVAPGTAVDYVVSKGPEPTPDARPRRRRPRPTPPPTPTPTPPPTPTPGPVNVGDYTCQTLEVATTNIDVDGFSGGVLTPASAGTPDQDWIVVGQDPAPGQKQPLGTADRPHRRRPGRPEHARGLPLTGEPPQPRNRTDARPSCRASSCPARGSPRLEVGVPPERPRRARTGGGVAAGGDRRWADRGSVPATSSSTGTNVRGRRPSARRDGPSRLPRRPAPGDASTDGIRRRPAGPHLRAAERHPPRIEPAQAEAGGDAAAEVPARRARRRRTTTDPAA